MADPHWLEISMTVDPELAEAVSELLSRFVSNGVVVESGVTFVTINHYEADVDWWDDHSTIEKNLRKRLCSRPLSSGAGDSLATALCKRALVRVLFCSAAEQARHSSRCRSTSWLVSTSSSLLT